MDLSVDATPTVDLQFRAMQPVVWPDNPYSLRQIGQHAWRFVAVLPGVDKTHLGIALAIHACTARRSVLFTHAPDLLDQLLAADASHTLGKVLDQLRRLDLW